MIEMGAHSADVDRDKTGSISTQDLLRAAMQDSGQQIHEDHFPDYLHSDQFAPERAWGKGVLDRAVRTALQSAAAWFMTAQATGLVFDYQNVVLLGGVVVASVVLSVLTALLSAPSFDDSWWYQVLERAVKTFAQSVLAGWGVTESVDVFIGGFPPNFTTILTSAGVAAATSVAMSILTTNMGNPDTVDLTVPK